MFIGAEIQGNKLYRGSMHTDGAPLTSKDIHEYADTLYMKSALITNSLVGSGVLNEPEFIVSSTGVSLESPYVLLLDGDVALIQSESEILKESALTPGVYDGILCIVGWYQLISDEEKHNIRAYGGVNNSILEYDLFNEELQVQPSGRCQFRWDTVYISRSTIEDRTSDQVIIEIPKRNAKGDLETGTIEVATHRRLGNILIADRPESMSYAASELYIIPLIKYQYDPSTGIISPETITSPGIKEGVGFQLISSTEEPDNNLVEGMIWYHPESHIFHIYVQSVGFVPISSNIRLLHLQSNKYISTSEVFSTPTNISIPIGVESYTPDDIVNVSYEGLSLTEGIHYSLDTANKSITLLDFTTERNELVTIDIIKIVSAVV